MYMFFITFIKFIKKLSSSPDTEKFFFVELRYLRQTYHIRSDLAHPESTSLKKVKFGRSEQKNIFYYLKKAS